MRGCGRRKGRGTCRQRKAACPWRGSFRRVDGCDPAAPAAGRRWPGSARRLDMTQVHGLVVWSGLAGNDAIAGAAGPGLGGRSYGPAGYGDAAGGHRHRNLTAPLDLPLWARTIKRAVRHERLPTIKACCRGSPRLRLIFEIKYCIGSLAVAVAQGPLSPASCGALWGSWTGKRRRCSAVLPPCLPFPQVKGQTASPRMVVRGRVELPTFRFSDAF